MPSIEKLTANIFLNLPKGKPGYVYILKSHNEVGEDIYKIGFTKNLDKRMSALKTSNLDLTLLSFFPTFNMNQAEKLLHKSLDSYRVGGEFFILPPDVLNDVSSLFTDLNNYYRLWQRLKREPDSREHLNTEQGCP